MLITHEPYNTLMYKLYEKSGKPDLKWLLTESLKIHYKLYYNPKSLTHGELEILNKIYRIAVSYVDVAIGQFIEILQKELNLDEVLVFITSDNGTLLGEHNLVFRGTIPYEQLIHVPLIVYYPGEKICLCIDKLVSLIDLMPMILTVANKMLSCNPIEILLDLASKIERRVTFTETVGSKMVFSCRTKKMKYILMIDENGTLHEKLYDLEADPRESKNLASHEGDLCKHFRKYVIKHIREVLHQRHVLMLKEKLKYIAKKLSTLNSYY